MELRLAGALRAVLYMLHGGIHASRGVSEAVRDASQQPRAGWQRQWFLLPSTESVPDAQAAVGVLGHLGRARGPAGEVDGRRLPAARLHTAVLCGSASVRHGPDVADDSNPAQLWRPFPPTYALLVPKTVNGQNPTQSLLRGFLRHPRGPVQTSAEGNSYLSLSSTAP